MEELTFKERQIDVEGTSIHLVETGDTNNQAVLFLHGYPETAIEFSRVISYLQDKYYLLAIDLPGFGKSDPIEDYDKKAIASLIKNLLTKLNLKKVVLVGHDVGGMITYSFVKNFPQFVDKAVIVCTSIPGVKPWEDVKRNPYIWHFAFYAVPELPEKLIEGKHEVLFEYFYNTISFNKKAIKPEDKAKYVEAYKAPHSLKTALGWYRAFPKDEKDNQQNTDQIDTPVLYLKGEKDFGDIGTSLEGLKDSGLINVEAKKVPASAHFAPEENPEFVTGAIADFIGRK